MSADNGVYILETLKGQGKEFRVAELQSIEDYEWDNDKGIMSDDPDIHIKNAREMWHRSKVFNNEADALIEAKKMYDETMSLFGIIEYGISSIEIEREF